MDRPRPLASEPLSETFDQIADWLEQWRREQQIPGLAFVVTDTDRTLRLDLLGTADLVTDRPVTADLRWQIGSVSKAFTAIALLQLERVGQVSLADPVQQHLPWAVHLRADVTLHQLLTHTAGLPAGSEWCPDSLAETALLGALGNPQPPGGGFHYSNCGYEAAGDVVEALTGQHLDRYLEDAVLRPLGMVDARGAVRASDRDREVQGHGPPDDDRRWSRDRGQVPLGWFPTCTADGSITATPEDLATYARFLLRGDAAVLHPLDHERLSYQYAPMGEGQWYGYGVWTTDSPHGRSIGHSGGMVGTYMDVRVDPELGIGCALFINGLGDADPINSYLLNRIRSTITGRPVPPEPTYEPTVDVVDDSFGPAELTPYVGLYRANNPWAPTFRVIRREGALALVEPITGETNPLLPRIEGGFHHGTVHSPELVTFDLLVGDSFQVLNYSGCAYYRARREPA